MQQFSQDRINLGLRIDSEDIGNLPVAVTGMMTKKTKTVLLDIGYFRRVDDEVIRALLAARDAVRKAGARFDLSGVNGANGDGEGMLEALDAAGLLS